MKNKLLIIVFTVTVALSVLVLKTGKNRRAVGDEQHKPIIAADGKYGAGTVNDQDLIDGKPAKLAGWSEENAESEMSLLEERMAQKRRNPPLRTRNGMESLANGQFVGEWRDRGPSAVNGAWSRTEMEDGTDTVYAVSCGHYGGKQVIYKGTIYNNGSGGDDFKPFSSNFLTRWSDVSVLKLNGKKIFLGTVEKSSVWYTDDDGETWNKSTGLPSRIYQTVVNRGDGNKVYSTDGQDLYLSTDGGISFSKFASLGTKKVSRLLSPRYENQPGYGEVYVAHGGEVKKLVGTSFTTLGRYTDDSKVKDIVYYFKGDERAFYINGEYLESGSNKKQTMMVSRDGGKTWTARYPMGTYYGSVGLMDVWVEFGINPEDPRYGMGNYNNPTITTDYFETSTASSDNWSKYAGGRGTIAGQTEYMRYYYHVDIQSASFYYDKDGKVLALLATDGGIALTRNLWTNYGNDGSQYYVITLLNGASVTETYSCGLVNGMKGPDDFALGTQDQGSQSPGYDIPVPTDNLGDYMKHYINVCEEPGGDGPSICTGPHGNYMWEKSNDKIKGPMNVYNGDQFAFRENWKSYPAETQIPGMKNLFFDVEDEYKIWCFADELVEVTYNGSSLSKKTHSFGNSGKIGAVAQSTGAPNTIYVLDKNKVYKSTNRGSSWDGGKSVSMNASGDGRFCYGAASPTSPNTVVFLGKSDNSVSSIYTTDGGNTWNEASGFPNKEISWMQFEKDGCFAMASTSVGPYVFDAQVGKWFDATGVGGIHFAGQWGSYNPNTNTFRFSTWGQGLWDFVIDDGAPKLGITYPTGGSLTQGENVTISWNTNQEGSVTVDLMKGTSKIRTIGSTSNDNYEWTIEDSDGFGRGYSIRLTLGELVATGSEFSILPDLSLIPQQNITLESFSSEHDDVANAAANVLDGDESTFWHTSYAGGAPNYPHELVFKVDGIAFENLLAFSYTPRSGAGNGTVKGYELFVSADGSDWIKAVSGELSGRGDEEIVLLDDALSGTESVFVKFKALSEINGNQWASMSEFNLYCDSYGAAVLGNKDISLQSHSISLVSGSKLQVTLPEAENVRVSILELNGRKVAERNLNLQAGVSQVDLASERLASKLYVVKMRSKSKIISRKFLLK